MIFKLNETWRDKLFFTSDTHFGHKNIIDYCERPFLTSKEMDDAMIRNWNKVVPEDGLVFHLGDFAMKSAIARDMLPRLNGTIILIKGNHDSPSFAYDVNDWAYMNGIQWKYGTRIMEMIDLKVEDPDIGDPGCRMTLCHYPMGAWNYGGHGAVQLYGHVHSSPGKANYYKPTAKQYDVGVDNNNFAPVSYKDILMIFTKKALEG